MPTKATKKPKASKDEFSMVLQQLTEVAVREVEEEKREQLTAPEAPSENPHDIITNQAQRRVMLDEIHHKLTLYFTRILDAAGKVDEDGVPLVELAPQTISAIIKFLNDNGAKLGIITPESPLGNILNSLPFSQTYE